MLLETQFDLYLYILNKQMTGRGQSEIKRTLNLIKFCIKMLDS